MHLPTGFQILRYLKEKKEKRKKLVSYDLIKSACIHRHQLGKVASKHIWMLTINIKMAFFIFKC